MSQSPEGVLAGYEFWRNVGNVILIVGLVGDVLIVVRTASHERWAEKVFTFIATTFVALGVMIEFGSGLSATVVSRQIRQRSAERIAALNLEAEHEHLARVQLEKEMQPRRLSKDQISTIKSKLAKFEGAQVKVMAQASDAESVIFGNDLYRAFRDSGLKASHNFGLWVGEAHTGVLVEVTQGPNSAAEAAVDRALYAADVVSAAYRVKATPENENTVIVLVGQKPVGDKIDFIETATSTR